MHTPVALEGLTVAEAVRLIFAPETPRTTLANIALTIWAEKRNDLGMIYDLPEAITYLGERLQ